MGHVPLPSGTKYELQPQSVDTTVPNTPRSVVALSASPRPTEQCLAETECTIVTFGNEARMITEASRMRQKVVEERKVLEQMQAAHQATVAATEAELEVKRAETENECILAKERIVEEQTKCIAELEEAQNVLVDATAKHEAECEIERQRILQEQAKWEAELEEATTSLHESKAAHDNFAVQEREELAEIRARI